MLCVCEIERAASFFAKQGIFLKNYQNKVEKAYKAATCTPAHIRKSDTPHIPYSHRER